MAITIYTGSGSPFAWRVLLALGFKGLEYDNKVLQFDKGDTQKPDYLALNPRGKVPTLVDGDVTVYESLAILAYLDRAYPEKPILGETPAEAAHIWQRTLEFESYFGSLVPKVARPLFMGTYEGQEKEINAHIEEVAKEISVLEGWLEDAEYMAGNSPTAVDFSAYPAFALLARVMAAVKAPGINMDFLPSDTRYPRITSWMKRMEQVPGYEAAYPPHWK